jgi:glycosyltransferase involved in cell wall biosynthesis
MTVVWNGTSLGQEANEGYKNAEDNIVSRLKISGIDIYHTCLSQFAHVECDVLINNRLPIDYQISNGYNIGFSYWETSELPPLWVEKMNMMDEIWTTSAWAKDVFIKSGVTVPVYDFKLGIDPEYFYPKLRERKYHFKFGSIGSPSTRKNSQMAVDAFLKLFGDNDSVKMIYKSMGPPDARINNKTDRVKSLYDDERFSVIDRDLSQKAFANLYENIDCLIYPTSGEGWGLIPHQAIAKGIPTICTNATACTEYAHLSVPLDFEYSDENMSGIYSGSGRWAIPNFDDLCDKMLYIYNNYDLVAKQTYENVKDCYDGMTWDYASKGYESRLCQILNDLKIKH